MKESYQRTVLTVTEFSDDDVIVTSVTSDPGNSGENPLPYIPGSGGLGGMPSGPNNAPPGTWYG